MDEHLGVDGDGRTHCAGHEYTLEISTFCTGWLCLDNC
ncbi:MAG: hypothetical protein RIQ50_191, partial [Bacteroidota bacterium]